MTAAFCKNCHGFIANISEEFGKPVYDHLVEADAAKCSKPERGMSWHSGASCFGIGELDPTEKAWLEACRAYNVRRGLTPEGEPIASG